MAPSHHACHFHAGRRHLELTLARFLDQAIDAAAQVRHALPGAHRSIITAWLLARGQPRERARPITLPTDPGGLEAVILDALEAARRGGYAALWCLVYRQQLLNDLRRWQSNERVWNRLCRHHPLTVLCCYDGLAAYTAEQVDAVLEHHASVYRGGTFIPHP